MWRYPSVSGRQPSNSKTSPDRAIADKIQDDHDDPRPKHRFPKQPPSKRKLPMETQFSQALKWLPNVVALIAACYGIAFQQSILQSSRPLLPTNSETKSGPRAYARLWDDPFVVFPQDRNPPISDCTRCLSDEAPTLLAFVLLDGLSYAEDDELRLRSRFAVQKALTDLGSIPGIPRSFLKTSLIRTT